MQMAQNAVNKLICLEVPLLDSVYELMLGRTEPSVPGDGSQENYYRGAYFLANPHNNTFTTFHHPVHYSRFLERGIAGGIDCVAIASWLNSVASIDTLIASPTYRYSYDFQEQERKKYYDSLREENS